MKKSVDAMAIVSAIILIFIGLTWIIPAGEYQRIIDPNTGRTIIDPNTFVYIKSTPQSILSFFTAPMRGFVLASEVIAFVLLVGGAFAVFSYSKALDAGLQRMLFFALKKKEYKISMLWVLIFMFSLAGSTFGMSEEVLVFILISIPLARSMGYDNIVGVAIPFVGAGAGFAGAFINPFTIQIAQGIAEIPLASGMNYRIVVWFFYTLISGFFIVRYAVKIEKNPMASLLSQSSEYQVTRQVEQYAFDLRRKITVFLFAATIVLLIVGVKNWDWYIGEIAALFIAMGMFTALVNKIPVNVAFEQFRDGARQMLAAALIIAMSRAILVVAEDGKIIDSILHYLAQGADSLPNYISVQVMFAVQGIINFFIPSGSGQAALTMPIMAPLADVLHISRQTAVLAFQFGDGLFNLVIPTSGVTMGVLSIAGIEYNIWIKWIWKLMISLILLSMVFLAIAVLISYQ